MMARNTNVPFKGRIQKRKTHDLQIITFGLQRAAGPYRWAKRREGENMQFGLGFRWQARQPAESVRAVLWQISYSFGY